MITIYKTSGEKLRDVVLTKQAESTETLMSDDSIKLSWDDVSGDELPVGAYIVADNGEQYRLLDPYIPEQKSEKEWKYEPVFVSRVSAWSRVPFFFYTETNNVITSREPDWNITDSANNIANVIAKAIYNETGEEWTVVTASDLDGYKTLSFQSTDIRSALNLLANEFETEWRADKTTNTLYIGKAMFESNTVPTLEVGENIKVPSVTDSREGYYNRFYVFGSTRNITQEYHGANVNNLVNKRLTLDPTKYPHGYIDTRTSQSEPILSKILTFDDIYPKSNLIVTEARPRLMYVLKEGTNEKVQIGTDDDGNPIYDQYTIWYVQLGSKDENGKITPFRLANKETYSEKNPNGTLIAGKALSIHFSSGALNSREFEVDYKEADKVEQNSDGVDFQVKVGDFEILFQKDNNFIVPAMTGVVPNVDDTAILFNLRMPAEYIAGAYLELEESAKSEIAETYTADRNNYEFASNPVAFADNDTLLNLQVGQKVIYKNGNYSYETRILSITRKLDLPVEQTIKVGNDRIKGNTETLREDVANANKDINLIASFNQLTQTTINNYNRAIASMTEGFDRIAKMWYFDPKNPDVLMSNYTVASKGNLVGLCVGDEIDLPKYVTEERLQQALAGFTGGGGMDLSALEEYLKSNEYVTKQWVLSQGFLTGITGYLPLSGGTMTNTNVVTNLNADMLDGLHSSSFLQNYTTEYDFNNAVNSGAYRIGNYYQNGPAGDVTYGQFFVVRCNGDTLAQFAFPWMSTSAFLRCGNTVDNPTGLWRPWREFAFTDSNVASATRLQGTYSLWGQSFYGNDVSGRINISSRADFAGLYDEGLRIVGNSNEWCGIFLGTDGTKKGYTATQWNISKTDLDSLRISRGCVLNSFLEIFNDGTVRVQKRFYLSDAAYLEYDASKDVVYCNKTIVTPGNLTALKQ